MKKLLLILLCVPLIGVNQKWIGDDRNSEKIIGWGQDGFVSYLIIESYEKEYGEGDFDIIYNLNFNVQNLKTDELVYNTKLNKFNSESLPPGCWDAVGDDTSGANCFNYIYMKYKDIIIETHQKYNITNFHQNTFFYDFSKIDRKYSLVLDTVSINNECYNYDFGNRDRFYKLYIYNSLNQRKLISSGEFKCTGEIYLNGFYRSPFEDRLLISITSQVSQADYEPIDQQYHEFIGCSLNPSTFK
tara:strand:- start:293 stop:1024 length:732 start_codon:yes stop_codon:yes gene_type:complete